MLRDFQDRVAVVTGAASGIGRALALGFAAEGMRVAVADVDEDGAADTATRIGDARKAEGAADAQKARGAGDAARAFGVDVSSEASVAALADACFDAFGRVDLLVNNAGVFQGGLCWERSADDWDWVLGVNVHGILHAIRHFVPRMIAQDSEGHVVNTASVAAFVAGPTAGPYTVSKCAALAIGESLALDLAAVGSKIGASVLVPSAFDTGIADTAKVRPARFGRDPKPDAAGTAQALAQMTAAGQDPAAVVAPVLAAVRTGQFLIPTRPSYAEQLRSRFEALRECRLPPLAPVD
jgi:NAD(P)-dependent dehydrogenase (short-subunit alcohol dehydrogenase family)